jgi:hypothetical protein
MIHAIVESAFKTGCLSVESEALIRQIIAKGGCKSTDLDALQTLWDAVNSGTIRREAMCNLAMPLLEHQSVLR